MHDDLPNSRIALDRVDELKIVTVLGVSKSLEDASPVRIDGHLELGWAGSSAFASLSLDLTASLRIGFTKEPACPSQFFDSSLDRDLASRIVEAPYLLDVGARLGLDQGYPHCQCMESTSRIPQK